MKARLGVIIALMTLSALTVAACGATPVVETATVEGTPWTLVSYLNADNQTVELLPGTEITSIFNRGEISGSGSCNRYAGAYTTNGDKVVVKVGGTSAMYCPPEELMAQEKIFLGNLNRAASYKMSANRLEVYDSEGYLLLTYRILEPEPLVGTTWGLMTLNNGKGGLTSALAGTDITAVFDAAGNMAGSAGCNTYNAAYQLDGQRISIGPAASTKMACAEPEGIMEQEAAYLAALQAATLYTIEGDELVLSQVDGTKMAVFAARTGP